MNRIICLCGTLLLFATINIVVRGQDGTGACFFFSPRESKKVIWAGNDDPATVNSTFIQPFLAYNTRDAWTYTVNAETSYDWNVNHWGVPIHLTVTKLVRSGKHPVSIGGALRCWVTSPPGGPDNCGFGSL